MNNFKVTFKVGNIDSSTMVRSNNEESCREEFLEDVKDGLYETLLCSKSNSIELISITEKV
jgi:hypothetical protein